MKTYNGHRSWNAWNVSLWLNNDENLYNTCTDLVQRLGAKKAARIVYSLLKNEKTPDGAKYNRISIYNAIKDWEA
jgi:hypothetical protein